MSPQVRALLIGMFGPVLQAAGVAWDLLEHVVLERGQVGQLTLTHILSGAPHLVIFTGLIVSVICIPLAIEVAVARPEELKLPEREPQRAVPEIGLETAEATK